MKYIYVVTTLFVAIAVAVVYKSFDEPCDEISVGCGY